MRKILSIILTKSDPFKFLSRCIQFVPIELDYAIKTGFLIYSTEDPNKILFRSARLGNIKGIKIALRKGATDISLALYQACIGGNIECVKLLKKGRKTQCIFGACLGYTLKDSLSYSNFENVKNIIDNLKLSKLDKEIGLDLCKLHFSGELLEFVNLC